MIALIAGMGDNRSPSMRRKERRKSVIEHLDLYRKSLHETAEFRAAVLKHNEKSTTMDTSELQNLIQKFGRIGLAAVSKSKDLFHRTSSGSSRYHALVPSEEELIWILSASSRLKRNRMIVCDLQFALV
jgi:hypothetical protein